MADYDDIDELKAKWICHKCVGEEFLSAEMKTEGRSHKCAYCGTRGKSYSIGDMADRIESVFEEHFTRTSEHAGFPVNDAIADAASIPEDAAKHIQAILEEKNYDHEAAKMGDESEFDADSFYEEKGVSDIVWQEEWRYFERVLKTEARFFSKVAAEHLASIFGGIDKMSDADGQPLVKEAGPGTSLTAFYRARVFQSDDKLNAALCRPDLLLGSPSMIDAASGRMNARGISVFYGANEADVAIAEVRPPVGSWAIVARFDVIRGLRLLDLTALSKVSERGSVFDSGFSARLERATFLQSLSERITQPVMPDDEAFDYLTTQAIADFLATENEPALDGILFPSAQASGDALNVVLFHKAARVETIDLPDGIKIEASTGINGEDGWESWFTVRETVPPKSATEDKIEDNPSIFDPDLFVGAAWNREVDLREPALKIDLSSMKVHQVQKVKFEYDEHTVQRYRSER